MTRVQVIGDSGEVIWTSEPVESWHLNGLTCPGNRAGQSFAGGLRRAIQDAEVIAKGGDPERPSEKAMRLAEAAKAQFIREQATS